VRVLKRDSQTQCKLLPPPPPPLLPLPLSLPVYCVILLPVHTCSDFRSVWLYITDSQWL